MPQREPHCGIVRNLISVGACGEFNPVLKSTEVDATPQILVKYLLGSGCPVGVSDIVRTNVTIETRCVCRVYDYITDKSGEWSAATFLEAKENNVADIVGGKFRPPSPRCLT